MRSDFQFANLLGTVYRLGNLVFTPDGKTLLLPVGNRVLVFDLVNNKLYTLPWEHRRDVACIALNPQANLLLTVDVDGRAILANFVARTVLHHMNFKQAVHALLFLPDGTHFALAVGRFVQIWRTPLGTEDRLFAPFVRHRVHAGHHSAVTLVTWLPDLRFLLLALEDMTARLVLLHADEAAVATAFAGHRDAVVCALFNAAQDAIYTVLRDGAVFRWEYVLPPGTEDDESTQAWRIVLKDFFHSDAKVLCAAFHPEHGLLVVGFTNGEFRLVEVPTFLLVQQLLMGQNVVDTVAVNASGEWLAFGLAQLGQLLVYEWQLELYILKQQGHFDAMNALAYLPDGLRIVTASDDGKVKLWDIQLGFCLATFSDHTSAVLAVVFAKKGSVVFTALLDGTVRAYDLIRYRNFRTFTAAERVRFTALAADPSGEVVCAGSEDTFDVYVWLVQTAQLVDTLHGHEGPVLCLAFGAESGVLALALWDQTVRVWSVFGRSGGVEPLAIHSDVLALAMRPDSKEVAVATLSGSIQFWNLEEARIVHTIDGLRDILRGRYLEDGFTAKLLARGKCFSTIAYLFDGLALVAAGENNSICLYDIRNEVLLKRFTVLLNMLLNGTLEMLNLSRMTEGGLLDLVDRSGEATRLQDRIDTSLPGLHRGDPSARATRRAVRVLSIQFSPSAALFAAASTEGLLVFAVDTQVAFDPFDLDVDVTPAAIAESLAAKEYLPALVMLFRLNEHALIRRCYELVPVGDIPLVAASLPVVYLERILRFLGELVLDLPHLEFNLLWIRSLVLAHGKHMQADRRVYASAMRGVLRFLVRVAKPVVLVGQQNVYTHDFLAIERLDEDEDVDEDEEMESEEESEGGHFHPKQMRLPIETSESDLE